METEAAVHTGGPILPLLNNQADVHDKSTARNLLTLMTILQFCKLKLELPEAVSLA